MANERTYTGNNFILSLDGEPGYLKSFSGLGMKAEIASNALGPDNVVKKHVANIGWEPATFEVGIGMGNAVYQWIKASFDKGFVQKDGAFTAANFNFKAESVMNFSGALITEVGIPECSGEAKTSAYFTVKFQPETVRWAKGDKGDIRASIGPRQKEWLQCNYRIEIGNLPCNRVSKLDAMVWKQKVTSDQIGTTREPTWHPASVEVPNLKLTISHADHEAWAKAATEWFVNGKHTEADEMNGRIVYLGPNMKDELGEIELHNLGFAKFEDGKSDAGSEKVKNFTVELYCEQMKFNIKSKDM